MRGKSISKHIATAVSAKRYTRKNNIILLSYRRRQFRQTHSHTHTHTYTNTMGEAYIIIIDLRRVLVWHTQAHATSMRILASAVYFCLPYQ